MLYPCWWHIPQNDVATEVAFLQMPSQDAIDAVDFLSSCAERYLLLDWADVRILKVTERASWE